jgi:hypothetical protein
VVQSPSQTLQNPININIIQNHPTLHHQEPMAAASEAAVQDLGVPLLVALVLVVLWVSQHPQDLQEDPWLLPSHVWN